MSFAKKSVPFVLSSALLAAGLAGCSKGGDTPGEKLDAGLTKAGDAVKDAGEAIKPK
jgi:hypothetical protein